MKTSVEEYLQFFKWARTTAVLLARNQPVKLAGFMGDLEDVWIALVVPWGTLPSGSGFKLWGAVVAWILANPDPLRDARNKMAAMRATWG